MNFTLTGTMSPDNLNAAPNEVIAQLSDAQGNFGNPVELGRLTTNTSGSFTVQIPNVPDGQHYRIRVVSTNYPMVGENIQEVSIQANSGMEESLALCTYYPNPFSSTLSVTTEKAAQSVCIYDIFGRLLKQQPVSKTQFDLNLSDFVTGAYLMQVNYGDSRSVHRIMKAN